MKREKGLTTSQRLVNPLAFGSFSSEAGTLSRFDHWSRRACWRRPPKVGKSWESDVGSERNAF